VNAGKRGYWEWRFVELNVVPEEEFWRGWYEFFEDWSPEVLEELGFREKVAELREHFKD
jgi:hypothetical protein